MVDLFEVVVKYQKEEKGTKYVMSIAEDYQADELCGATLRA